jgi:hypothetical protein
LMHVLSRKDGAEQYFPEFPGKNWSTRSINTIIIQDPL